ncbi:hypothetical protein UA08_06137 [Talaromyces atroroseus]|uniref:Phosphotransferase n=1 Tax=Talaromyces atroroseus TaxID=1441469 RepID=A0A225AK22_TALAT|nr:hypothetical protein UA08_06137 [Talaromyces atroroseus]OKL58644.1 hypothetical protein UA08_06137 [Talaromyces atroroseus]
MATTPDSPSLQQFLSPLTAPLSEPSLYRLSYHFSQTYKHLAACSTEYFFPTPITHLPTGREQGRYLAVYVGLYYLHVGFIELLGCDQGLGLGQEYAARRKKKIPVRRTLEKAWPIEARLKWEHPVEFFAWIGTCIAEVVGDSMRNENEQIDDDAREELVAGISFCFPIVQKSLDEAVLLPTSKGFALASDLNLQQALLDGYEWHTRPHSTGSSEEEEEEEEKKARTSKRRKKHISLPKLKIAAMTNDTVATFASLAYSIKSLHAVPNNSRVVMGLMVGAGCNATVPMKVSSLHPSKTEFITADSDSNSNTEKETLVSTEWTLLRSSQPLLDMHLLTRWDKHISAQSQPPGFQPMEYMVGGRYMGELVRLIVLEYFTIILKIPRDILPWRLLESGGLTTEFLSLNVASSFSSPALHNDDHLDHTEEAKEGKEEKEDAALASTLNTHLPSAKGWTWNADKARILRTVAYAVQSRSTAIIAAATVGLLACIGEIHLEPAPAPTPAPTDKGDGIGTWNHGPEELVVAFSGGLIQNYPRYKENVQRHIDRLLVHGGPQQGGKSILLREVSDGGIIGVGVLAGCSVRRGIEGIVGSRLDV